MPRRAMRKFDFGDEECSELLKLYTRERWLGGGSQATVYEVSDEHRAKYAAKMFLRQDEATREARIMSKLRRCPGTVQFRRAVREEAGGRCFGSIVIDLYGPSLWNYWMAHSRQLNEKEVAAIVKKLAETLRLVHARGIVHCDLKLENVFLMEQLQDEGDSWDTVRWGRSDQVVIGDFGVAADDEKDMNRFSGTDAYMSPEVFAIGRGVPNKYTAAVDVWGLGVMAYELLGAKLKNGMRDRGEFQWPAGLSDDAKELVSSMLARDPEERSKLDAVLKHRWVVQHTAAHAAAENQNTAAAAAAVAAANQNQRHCGAKRSLPDRSCEELQANKKVAI